MQALASRLIMLSCFTAFVAISVGLLTSPRRVEMFGSTAVYAAVLVVFVSSNLGNPSLQP